MSWSSLVFILVFYSSACSANDDILTSSGKSFKCKDARYFSKDCQVSVTQSIVLSSAMKNASVTLYHDEKRAGQVEFNLVRFEQFCVEIDDFYTRNVNATFKSVLQCNGRYNCSEGACKNTVKDSYISDLEEANLHAGRTFCRGGYLNRQCTGYRGVILNSCTFFRTFAFPLSTDIYRITHCNKWIDSAVMEVSINWEEDRKNTKTITLKRGTSLHISSSNVTLRWLSYDVPVVEIAESKFIRNLRTKEVFVWPKDQQPIVLCNSAEQAMSTKECEYRETCRCGPTYDNGNCRCSKFSIKEDIEENEKMKLPVKQAEIIVKNQNGSIVSEILEDFVVQFSFEMSHSASN